MTELFSLKHTVTLYDLTNTFFFLKAKPMASPRPEFGGTRKRSAATARCSTLGEHGARRLRHKASCAAPKSFAGNAERRQ